MKRIGLFINVLAFVATSLAQTNTFPSSGNVGIGTTSPSFQLHSKATGGSSVALTVETDQTEAYLSLKASGTSSLSSCRIGVTGESLLFLTNGATERLRIDGSGNVGVGTTSPVTAFHISSAGNPGTAITIENTAGAKPGP